jgi:hypothetical protein
MWIWYSPASKRLRGWILTHGLEHGAWQVPRLQVAVGLLAGLRHPLLHQPPITRWCLQGPPAASKADRHISWLVPQAGRVCAVAVGDIRPCLQVCN